MVRPLLRFWYGLESRKPLSLQRLVRWYGLIGGEGREGRFGVTGCRGNGVSEPVILGEDVERQERLRAGRKEVYWAAIKTNQG